MLKLLFGKQDVLSFERTSAAPIGAVREAVTQPEAVLEWWGPNKTAVTECEIDVQVGGRIRIVMQATEAMGKYAGTQWPLEGTVTEVVPPPRFVYDACPWVEGRRETTTIEHVNELVLVEARDDTTLRLTISVGEIGSGAKMAAVGMK